MSLGSILKPRNKLAFFLLLISCMFGEIAVRLWHSYKASNSNLAHSIIFGGKNRVAFTPNKATNLQAISYMPNGSIYKLTAVSSKLDAVGNFASMENPAIKIFSKNNDYQILATSKTGQYSSDTGFFELKGDVSLNLNEEYRLTTQDLWIDVRNRSSFSKSPIFLTTKQGTINADRFSTTGDGLQMNLFGARGVTTTLYPNGFDLTQAHPTTGGAVKNQAPITILSKTMIIKRKENLVEFVGNVIARQEKLTFGGGKMSVISGSDATSSPIKRLDLCKDVLLNNGEFQATAQNGSYTMATNSFELIDKVTITDARGVVTGDKFDYDSNNKISTIKGRAVVVLEDKKNQ